MTIDGRRLSHDTLETMRRMAVRRVTDGERPSRVIASYGMCRTTVYKWLRTARRGGLVALRARKGTGRPPVLKPRHLLRVRQWISGRDPRHYGFAVGLWTRKIIADLIQERCGRTLGLTAVGRWLHRLEVTPQKPLRRAYERDPVAIERWKREVFPRLKARAQRVGARIFFLDEAGVRSDQVLGRTWGRRGHTPEVPTSGHRQSVNAISAVNARGTFWYELYGGRLNARRFTELLGHFLRRRRSRMFLVLDRHPAHIAKRVAKFVQQQRGRLELHFLPGYAPELNPDEFVWNYVKTQGVAKTPLRAGESLRRRVALDLARIGSRPALVRSFFCAPSVAYITD